MRSGTISHICTSAHLSAPQPRQLAQAQASNDKLEQQYNQLAYDASRHASDTVRGAPHTSPTNVHVSCHRLACSKR